MRRERKEELLEVEDVGESISAGRHQCRHALANVYSFCATEVHAF